MPPSFAGNPPEFGPTQLLAVLRVEQRQCWLRGEPLPVEAILERHAALRDNREAILDLVYSELIIREELGETPSTEEYLQRFPEHSAELKRQLEVHQQLKGSLFRTPETVAAPAEPEATNSYPDGDLEATRASPKPSGHLTAPSALVPGYEILGELGRGGMGVVYKARDVELNRVVALKMVLYGAHASKNDLARFRAEAEAAATLDHSTVVSIYEIGDHEGQPYFTMKFVEGGSLAQHESRPSSDAKSCARLVSRIAHGVHHAHQRGILHRDLKPANILIDRNGDPLITDFGLARRLEQEGGLTQSGALLGTPAYMAPEQAAGKKATTLADIYGLGAILYEILTGRPPFRGETVLETLHQVQHQEPAPPSSINPRVDRNLQAICLKCLAKDPLVRYETAEALAVDLERWLAGEPLQAHPLSLAAQVGRWLRMNIHVAAWPLLVGLVCGIFEGLSGLSKTRPILAILSGAYDRFPSIQPPFLPDLPWPEWCDGVFFVVGSICWVGAGLITVCLVRPRDRWSDAGAGLACGFVAALISYGLTTGPMSMMGATIRSMEDMSLLAGTDFWLEPLNPLPPGTDRVARVYPDLKHLSTADRARALEEKVLADLVVGGIEAVWIGLAVSFISFFALTVYQTMLAGHLQRDHRGFLALALTYLELVLPSCWLLSLLWGMPLDLRYASPSLPAELLVRLLLLAGWIVLGHGMVFRGWHWRWRLSCYLVVAWLTTMAAPGVFVRADLERQIVLAASLVAASLAGLFWYERRSLCISHGKSSVTTTRTDPKTGD